MAADVGDNVELVATNATIPRSKTTPRLSITLLSLILVVDILNGLEHTNLVA